MSKEKLFIWVSKYLERKNIQHTMFSNYRRDRRGDPVQAKVEYWSGPRNRTSNPRSAVNHVLYWLSWFNPGLR